MGRGEHFDYSGRPNLRCIDGGSTLIRGIDEKLIGERGVPLEVELSYKLKDFSKLEKSIREGRFEINRVIQAFGMDVVPGLNTHQFFLTRISEEGKHFKGETRFISNGYNDLASIKRASRELSTSVQQTKLKPTDHRQVTVPYSVSFNTDVFGETEDYIVRANWVKPQVISRKLIYSLAYMSLKNHESDDFSVILCNVNIADRLTSIIYNTSSKEEPTEFVLDFLGRQLQ